MKVRRTQNLRQNIKICNYFRKMAVGLNLFSFAKVHRPTHIQEQSYDTECFLHGIRKWEVEMIGKTVATGMMSGGKRICPTKGE